MLGSSVANAPYYGAVFRGRDFFSTEDRVFTSAGLEDVDRRHASEGFSFALEPAAANVTRGP